MTSVPPDDIAPAPATADELPVPIVGHPREQLSIEEPVLTTTEEPAVQYPSGAKLYMTLASLSLSLFLQGLDLTIVAVAVPSLTNEWNTLADIGWYSAAYGLTLSASIFFFGKLYTIFSTKSIFLSGLSIFLLGSVTCTFAASSKMFVVGRAVAGVGTSAVAGGTMLVLRRSFPLSKLAFWSGLVNGSQAVGLVCAPVVGGVLIDRFGWRACFGINVPLMVFCIGFTFYGMQSQPGAASTDAEMVNLSLKEKLKRIDILGSVLIVPAIVCGLLGLQWGGVSYGWRDWRIILLFTLFGVLLTGFGYLQYRQGDDATVPLRILKKRSILAGMWYSACTNGLLAMTEYYMAIYFQGVRGFTATRSGLLGLPMIAGLLGGMLAASAATAKIGYYYPAMYATSILAPVASGVLTTIDLDGSVVKPVLLLGLLGLAVGFGQIGPSLAVQTVLPTKDVSIGTAIIIFGAGMGSSMWICASATLFQNRLAAEIENSAPGTNITGLESAGLSAIRTYIGEDKLKDVLTGYNQAVVETLYMPLALAAATMIGSIAMERRSMKEKQR